MKNSIKIAVLLLAPLVVFQGCKDDDDTGAKPKDPVTTLTLHFEGTVGNEPLEMEKEYFDYANRKFELSMLSFYLSNIYLVDANQNAAFVKDVALVEFSENKRAVELKVKPGTYSGLRMGIGLDAVQNASDPSTFPADHPLSFYQGTYWDWAAKYKFIQLEGRADLYGNDTLYPFGYHTGLDTMYRTKVISHDFAVQSGEKADIFLTLDINDIFTKEDTVNILVEPNWHGSTSTAHIGIRISDNFVSSLEVRP